MNIHEAIQTRRSIPLVTEDPVPTDLIEKILESGTHAPNHYRTEPWRFFVLRGEGRVKLGEVFADVARSKEGVTEADNEIRISRSIKNPLRAPVIIAVGVEPGNARNVLIKEEYAAVNSSVQNMLLTAHALGLGAIWRTGSVCYEDKVRDFFGLSKQGEVIAFIYIGYPDMEPIDMKKTNYKELTTWID